MKLQKFLFKRISIIILISIFTIVGIIACSGDTITGRRGGGYYSQGSGGSGGSSGGSGGSGGGTSIGGFIDSVPNASGKDVTASDVIPINRIRMLDIYPNLKNDNDFKSSGLTDDEVVKWRTFLKGKYPYSIKLNTTENKIDFKRDYKDIFSNATWKKATDGSFQISHVYKYSDSYYDKVFVKLSFEEYYTNRYWVWNYGVIEYTFARKYAGTDKNGKYRDWSYIFTLTSDRFHFGTNTHLQ